jgi:protease IV
MYKLADILYERIKLKNNLFTYKILVSVLILCLCVMSLFFTKKTSHGDQIAKLYINDIIVEDQDLINITNDIENNNDIKAVIIMFSSPGGTAYGGELLYNAIKRISQKKPVVAVFGTMATSAAYLAAVAADHIVCGYSSMTGSIGVLIDGFDYTELMSKLGIKSRIYKTSEFKASPSPFTKTTPQIDKYINNTLDQQLDYFAQTVKLERNFSDVEIRKVSNGKIYLGVEALNLKLIDELGTEEQAHEFLEDIYDINPQSKIIEFNKLNKNENIFSLDYWLKSFIKNINLYFNKSASVF